MRPNDLKVGDSVRVHARGYWYIGKITRELPIRRGLPGRVEVTYTSGSGRESVTRQRRHHLIPVGQGVRRPELGKCAWHLAVTHAADVWKELVKRKGLEE